MKKILALLALTVVPAVSVSAFAQQSTTVSSYSVPQAVYGQSNAPVTRAEVKQQLKDLEAVGYNPATANDEDYPQNIQRTEKAVWQQHNQSQQ